MHACTRLKHGLQPHNIVVMVLSAGGRSDIRSKVQIGQYNPIINYVLTLFVYHSPSFQLSLEESIEHCKYPSASVHLPG